VDPTRALQDCGGAASWRRLRAVGVTWHALWLAVVHGYVDRLCRGGYALPGADAAMVAAVRLGGVLSCVSAARYHGLPLLIPRGAHVTVPRGWSHAQQGSVVVHRRELKPDEHDGLCTTLLRTVLDCSRELPIREAVAICDAALRLGLASSVLHEAAKAAAGPGARAIRRVVALADSGAESPIESLLRLLARPLARVELQVRVPGVGRVDMLLDGWLVVEADGFEHHSTRAHYRVDRRRANALTERGYVLLRFSYEDIVHRPDCVVETIRQVLARQAA